MACRCGALVGNWNQVKESSFNVSPDGIGGLFFFCTGSSHTSRTQYKRKFVLEMIIINKIMAMVETEM